LFIHTTVSVLIGYYIKLYVLSYPTLDLGGIITEVGQKSSPIRYLHLYSDNIVWNGNMVAELESKLRYVHIFTRKFLQYEGGERQVIIVNNANARFRVWCREPTSDVEFLIINSQNPNGITIQNYAPGPGKAGFAVTWDQSNFNVQDQSNIPFTELSSYGFESAKKIESFGNPW